MKLKEAFRYQSFLNETINNAVLSMIDCEHAFKVTRKHLISQSNPDEEDTIEEVDNGEFYSDDDVADLLTYLIFEKEDLTSAIARCKSQLDLDIDAAIEANKVRQKTIDALKQVLRYKGGVEKRTERSYKFNAEGNQVAYYYNVEDTMEELFDRVKMKNLLKRLTTESDNTSSRIELAYVTGDVDFTPTFSIGDSFEDSMEIFLSKNFCLNMKNE